MSSLVGLLKVSLTSDTAEFSTGFNKASKNVEDFSAKVDRAAVVARAGLVALGAATAAMVAQTARAGDEIAKLADRTGVSVEALSRLRYAADLSGSSITDIETAFKDLSNRMLQAQKGTGEAAEAFESLGIRTANADGSLRDMDQVLLDVADALSQSNDETAKAALAQRLFGESGVRLLPLLRQGREGIEQLGDEAERLGLVFSQEAAQSAVQFQDGLTRLQGLASGFAMTIGNELIPKLVDTLDYFDRLGGPGGLAKELASALGTALEAIIILGANVQFVFAGIGREIGARAAQAAALASLDFDAARIIGEELAADSEAARKALDEFEKKILGLGESASTAGRAVTTSLAPVVVTATAIDDSASGAADAIDKMASARKADIDAARNGLRTIAEQIRAQREQNEEIGLTNRELIELRYTRLQHAAAQLDERAATIALFQPNNELVTLYQQQAEALRELAETQRDGAIAQAGVDAAAEAERAWTATAQSIEQSLTDALLRGFEDGADFAENFRRTLLNMFQTLVLRPLIQPIVTGGMQAVGMGPAGGSGSIAGGSGGIPSIGGGGFSSLMRTGGYFGNSIGTLYANASGTGLDGLINATGGWGTMPTNAFAQYLPYLPSLVSLLQGDVKGAAFSAGGTAIGAALGGPVGAVVGSMLGSVVGGLFGGSGERFPRTVASSRGSYSDGRFESLGPDPDFFPDDDQFGGSMERALRKVNRAFSTRLGDLLDAFDIEADIDTTSQTRLRRTSGRLVGALFGAVGDAEFDFRDQFGGDAEIEQAFAEFVETAMTQGLAAAIRVSPLADNIKSIFAEELSGDEIDAAVDTLIGVASLKGRLDGMPQVFRRLSSSIDEVLDTDNFDDFEEAAGSLSALQAAVQTYYGAFTPLADQFRDAQNSLVYEFDRLGVAMPQSIADFQALADGLDLTTASGREMFQELMGIAPAFLDVAQAVEQTFDAISTSTASTIEQFMRDTMSDAETYRYLDTRIVDALDQLEDAFDPATIASLYEQANSDMREAWGLLSDNERTRLLDDYIERAYRLEEIAQDRLSVTPLPDTEGDATAVADAVGAAVEQAMIAASERFVAASGDQAAASRALAAAVSGLPDRIVIEMPRAYSEVGL